MKKFIFLLLAAMMLMLSSCSDAPEETTVPETSAEEITTKADPTLEDMSPSFTDVTLPEGFNVSLNDIDFDSMSEIAAEDSVFPETAHDRILQSDNAQYFFLTGDKKVHAVFFDENKNLKFSASYNNDTGFAEFIGDAEKSWYFDETGVLSCVVYSYTFGGKSAAPIYTFYSPEGEKEVTRTMDGWYTPDFDVLSNEEIMTCLKKYAFTIEATAEYK